MGIFFVAAALGLMGAPVSDLQSIPAALETQPIGTEGDAADDAAIWVHPTDPGLSLIFGTNKQSGLVVYDMSGSLLQRIGEGRPNNVDLRHGVRLGEETVDLVASSDRADNAIALYRVDGGGRRLEPIVRIPTGLTEVYGICLWRDGSGAVSVFINDKDGRIQQWSLDREADGRLTGSIAREFSVGSQPEGMVADDAMGALFVGEEDVGIWRFALDSTMGPPELVDGVGGHLAADVEGLAIYAAGDDEGYLIASSQGDNSYAVYGRAAPNPWLFSFRIDGGDIDGTEDCDGIEVTPAPLGAAFPFGAFIAQDGSNPGATQNFKLVPWESIARAASPTLHVNTTWRARP